MGRRILIKGGSGAGKTSLGRRLAGELELPFVELDALHHGPNWTSASAEELKASVRAQLDDERGWIVDGNYESKLGTLILDRAELIVWLDLPLRTKLERLVRRSLSRLISQEELWNGNRETVLGWVWGGDALFPWAIRSHFRHRRVFPSQLAGKRYVRLRSPTEVEAWVLSIGGPSQVPGRHSIK